MCQNLSSPHSLALINHTERINLPFTNADILFEQSPSSIQLALAVNLVALLCTAPYFFHMVVKMEPSEGVVSGGHFSKAGCASPAFGC